MRKSFFAFFIASGMLLAGPVAADPDLPKPPTPGDINLPDPPGPAPRPPRVGELPDPDPLNVLDDDRRDGPPHHKHKKKKHKHK